MHLPDELSPDILPVILAWAVREAIGLIGRLIGNNKDGANIEKLVSSVNSLVNKMDRLTNKLEDLVVELHKVKVDVESLKRV